MARDQSGAPFGRMVVREGALCLVGSTDASWGCAL